jgi:hypothetical protein
MWRQQGLQTFYISTDRKYFRVKTKDMEPAVQSMVASILTKAKVDDDVSAKAKGNIKGNEGRGENSPWLERTGWKRMFAGKDMENLASHVNVDVGLEVELIEVKESVNRMIDYCMASVHDLDTRGWNEIKFRLRSHQDGRPHEKPFRRPATELDKYKKVWTRLILFCWRGRSN